MLDTIKHAFHQKGHFLCSLIKTMFLCKSTLEDYYLNPQGALALHLEKHTHKIFLLTIDKIKAWLIGLTKITNKELKPNSLKLEGKYTLNIEQITLETKLKWKDSLDHDRTPFRDTRPATLVQMKNQSDLTYLLHQ